MKTEFDDSTKLAILMGTLKNIDEFDPLVTSESVMKKDDQIWRQVATLFVEEAKCLGDNTGDKVFQQETKNGHLAQLSRKMTLKQNYPVKGNVRCYYCNRKGHIAKECRKKNNDDVDRSRNRPPKPSRRKSFIAGTGETRASLANKTVIDSRALEHVVSCSRRSNRFNQ